MIKVLFNFYKRCCEISASRLKLEPTLDILYISNGSKRNPVDTETLNKYIGSMLLRNTIKVSVNKQQPICVFPDTGLDLSRKKHVYIKILRLSVDIPGRGT